MIGLGEGSPKVSRHDQIIFHLVMVILWGLSERLPFIPTEDFDPYRGSIRDYGPHRIYYFNITARDDLDSEELKQMFIAALEQYNKISTTVKPLFYGLEAIPHDRGINFTSTYIMVAT